MKRINLIPPEYRKMSLLQKTVEEISRHKPLMAVVCVISFFIFIYFYQTILIMHHSLSIKSTKNEISRLQGEIAKRQDNYSAVKSEKETLEEEIKRIEEKFKVLETASTRHISWSRVLAVFSGLIPQDLWITKISIKEGKLTAVGNTFDNQKVSAFMTGLDKSGYFRNTNFAYTEKRKMNDQDVINFEITTDLNIQKVER
ncbi:MAG TPA: PilN domain-containing protein [Candidatus Omnitrophota bacterium]|nr:PilN domain-containing protein [Candidatus Omnitrophota bacterium]HPS20618.1 PilN domain-containing protein [Candidatus Omnitrophota bacterium]